MRILLVTHLYPPDGVAGVERVSEQSARTLAAAGHTVTVLTRRATPEPVLPVIERGERDGITVITVTGGGAVIGDLERLAPRLERIFERTVLELEPDVVLIAHLMNHSPGYVAIAHHWRVPVVVELHDYYAACERVQLLRPGGEQCSGPEGGRACASHCFPHSPGERWRRRTDAFRDAVVAADALVSPSRFVADNIDAYLEAAAGTPHVIGNGVSAAASRPPGGRVEERRGPLHLAYLGVVIPHKGVHVLIDALRAAALPEARLTVAGPTTQPYGDELAAAAAEIGGLEVDWHGSFEPEELPALLTDVDAVVVPSLFQETFCIVAHEALALGIPVIASQIGALPEVVRDQENGLLFTTGDAGELSGVLNSLNSEKGLLDRLRSGIRPTDWISVEERTQRLESLLADTVAAGVRSASGRSPRPCV